jgi:outer membrane receptor protein involved in Fe transport
MEAQITTGTIRGTVSDSTGGALPGASVFVEDTATHATWNTLSDSTGAFAVLAIPVGTYNVKAAKEGFKAGIRQGVRIETKSDAVLDVVLEVGGATEQVVVRAREEALNTTNGEVSNMLSQEQIVELPQNTRSFSRFLALDPGTVPAQINTAQSASRSGLGAFVNGMRSFFNSFTLDGADIEDPRFPGNGSGSGGGLTLSNDAIAEFRVVHQNGSAEFGLNLGAHTILSSKRGASAIHGSAFEFFRNDAMDARNFFDPPKKPPFKQSQWGGSVGGPVPLDKKTFFYINYEGRRQRRSVSSVITVPTPALYAAVPDGPQNGYLKTLMQLLFPVAPQGSFAPGAPTASFPTRVLKNQDLNTLDGRIDHTFGRNHQFTGRYMLIRVDEPFGSVVGTGIPSADTADYRKQQNLLLRDTWTLGGNAVNEFLFAINRLRIEFPVRLSPPEVTSLGFSTAIGDPKGVPQILFNGTGLNFIGAPQSGPEKDFDTVFQVGEKFSLNKSKHLFNMGFDFEHNQDNTITPNTIRRQTTFVGFGPPFDNSRFGVTTGTFFSQAQNFFNIDSERGLRRTQLGIYANDTYRVLPTLTVDLGLRWEYTQPPSEVNGKLDNLYQLDANGKPRAGQSITDITRIGLFPTEQAGGLYKRSLSNFGPRLGLAWKMTDKLALQAGYSIMYGRLAFVTITEIRLNPPFVSPTSLAGKPFGTLNDPIRDGRTPVLNTIDPGLSMPRGDFYNITLQYAVDQNTVAQLGYVGSRGLSLDRVHAPNYGAGFQGARPNPSFGPIFPISSDASSNYNSLQAQVRRRFSKGLDFQTSYTFSKSLDNASGGTRAVGSGANFLSNFPTDQFNIDLNYGPSDFDIRHIFVARFLYQLPFKTSAAGLRGGLVNGWSIAGIASLRSGQAFSIFTGRDTNGDGVAADRATILGNVSNLYCTGCRKVQFLNASLRGTQVLDSTLAVSGRNGLYGPAFKNLDFAVHKNVPVSERVNLEFRGEVFNVFNRPQLDIPSNNLSASTFGVIQQTVGDSRQVQLALKIKF